MAIHDDSFRRVLRARDAIHARYAAPLRLDDLAHEAALSPFHFLRTFRAAFGETPHPTPPFSTSARSCAAAGPPTSEYGKDCRIPQRQRVG